jgi:hypothetical protein
VISGVRSGLFLALRGGGHGSVRPLTAPCLPNDSEVSAFSRSQSSQRREDLKLHEPSVWMEATQLPEGFGKG